MVLPALGCTLQGYRPEPIEPARVAEALGSRRSDDTGLRSFMERHNYAVSEWPLTQWDLEALTLMAVYFNPEMDVARANLAVQRAAEITAGQRPNPRANPLLEHHSAASHGAVDTPWSVGLGLDFPIETGGKREARIARAQSLNDEARLSLGETAWKVRSRLRQRFVDAFAADETAKLAQQELDLRKQEVDLLERRQKAGEVSPSEVTLARLRLQETRLAADSADGNIRAARAALAAALGLPFEETEKLQLSFGKLTESPFPALPEPEVQHAALQNRLDLRQGLDRYAASEATLREEIARQYPDIDLSPGFLWDQGDWIKSLGGAILLPLFNNNEGPIGEAEANRKLEAARFKSLEFRRAGAIQCGRPSLRDGVEDMGHRQKHRRDPESATRGYEETHQFWRIRSIDPGRNRNRIAGGPARRASDADRRAPSLGRGRGRGAKTPRWDRARAG